MDFSKAFDKVDHNKFIYKLSAHGGHPLTTRWIKSFVDLHALEQWEQDWSMEFNSDKCEVLRITRKRNLVIFPYKLHKKELNVTNAAKYLGVTISKDLN